MPRKKGRDSWNPASIMHIGNQDPAFGYRWCDTDQMNIAKKQAEGWEFVNAVTDGDAEHETHDPGTHLRYRDCVAMRLPRDRIEARTAHYDRLTNQSERDIVATIDAKAQKKIGPGARVDGKVTIIHD